jgi:hypothetical protein
MLGGQDFVSPIGIGLGEGKGIARVIYVLYDDSDKAQFDEMGGWKAIGSIKCVPYINGSSNSTYIIVRPIDSHFTRWPLINELVHIKRGVSNKSQGGGKNYDSEWYYTDILPTWGATEHNATPDSNILEKSITHSSTYQETTSGLTSSSTIKNKLSITGQFKETGTVNKLIKLPGDSSIEGRAGHSIRFGSSINGFNSPYTGPDRSPLIMMTNGHHDKGSKLPTFEDINKDGSSFYMLKGHDVGFDASSLNFDSFYTKVSTAVKSNYVEPLPSPNTPVSESASKTDSKVKVVDTAPTIVPVANATKTNETVKSEDDLKDLPNKESDLPFVKETEDIKIDLSDSDNDFTTVSDAPVNITNSDIKFETQINDYYCFVASTSMLLNSLGIRTSQNELSEFVGSDKNFNLTKVTKKYGKGIPQVVPLSGSDRGYSNIINTFKTLGKPFIIQRQSRKHPNDPKKNHFVVMTGVGPDGSTIIVDDPAVSNGKNIPLRISDLKTSGGTLRIIN